MINQHHIDCFLAVAQLHSFSRAAEQLFLSQPAVSKQILSLEQALGCTLFQRAPHKQVRLTAAGKLYYSFFSRTRDEFLSIQAQVTHMEQDIAGELRLGLLCGWNTAAFHLDQILASFHEQFPNIRILPSFLDMAALREGLCQNQLDIAITIRESLSDVVPLKSCCFAKVPRTLIYSARQSTFSPGEEPNVSHFKDSTFFIVADQHLPTDKLVLSFLKPYHIQPKIQLVPSIEMAISSAHSGLGVAVIDQWSREVDNKLFHTLPLVSCNHAVLAWHQERPNPKTEQFVRVFLARFHVLSGTASPP